MGLFNKFCNVVTGKTAFQNNIVAPFIIETWDKVEDYDNIFVATWIECFLPSSEAVIDYLLFNFNDLGFSKYRKQLNRDNIDKLHKILASLYLIIFSQSKDFTRTMKITGNTKKQFIDEIMIIMDYDKTDKHIFELLKHEQSNAIPRATKIIEQYVFENMIQLDLPQIIIASGLLSNGYKAKIQCLSDWFAELNT